MYVASAPIDPVRATAMAELPHLSRGINDDSADTRCGPVARSPLRAGIRLSSTKNARLTTGTKNSAASHGARPADFSRRIVIARPIQIKGSATATIVVRNLASFVESLSMRIASTGGIQ